MNYAFVNVRRPEETIVGDSVLDVVRQLKGVTFDFATRRAVFNGVPDTMSFSDEYTDAELPAAIADRVVQVYIRDRGWVLKGLL